METNPIPGNFNFIPFKRKKWCIFCYIYSIPHHPGTYLGATRSSDCSLASNNANEIFTEIKRSLPSPLVRAIDTDGLYLDEAIAWRRITKDDLKAEVDVMQQASYQQISLPSSVGELLGIEQETESSTRINIHPRKGVSPNSPFGALLLRLYTNLRLFIGYGVPLLIPTLIIKPGQALPLMAIFAATLLLAAVIWPAFHMKSWLKGILLGLFSTVIYGGVTYLLLPQFFKPGLCLAALLSGVLTGFLLDCTDKDD